MQARSAPSAIAAPFASRKSRSTSSAATPPPMRATRPIVFSAPRSSLIWNGTGTRRTGRHDGGMNHFDVVVCGLGVMGCAALYQLARRGQRVLGIERFTPGHDRGSSHGSTRIIRLSYFEHPSYVPLVQRSYERWRELEQSSGQQLLYVTGIAEMGPPDGAL